MRNGREEFKERERKGIYEKGREGDLRRGKGRESNEREGEGI